MAIFKITKKVTPARRYTSVEIAAAEANERIKREHEANQFFEHCAFCGKPAPRYLRLCDGRIGGGSLHHHNSEPTYFLCSAPLCTECGESFGEKDYCPFHSQHRDKITDFPNEGKYAGLRLKINSHSCHTSYGIDGWENPPYMFFCSDIQQKYISGK